MVQVIINGEAAGIQAEGLSKVADLIELVKASIDPEHMITDIRIDGQNIKDDMWYASTSSIKTSILEVNTNTPQVYIEERIAQAPSVIQACFLQFRDARKSFQAGKSTIGNQKLVTAVDTLRTFFNWFATIQALMTEAQKKRYDINSYVEEILVICKNINQHQLYHSWWAIGEALEKELEPMLDKLEDFLREVEHVL
jgi:hypothetical protein